MWRITATRIRLRALGRDVADTRARCDGVERTEVENIAGAVDPVAGADHQQPPLRDPDGGSPGTLQGVPYHCGTVIPPLEQQVRAPQGEQPTVVGDDLHRKTDAGFEYRLLVMNPVHPVPGCIFLATLVGTRQVPSNFRHQYPSSRRRRLIGEALLPAPVWCRPLRHSNHPRAWGWCTA